MKTTMLIQCNGKIDTYWQDDERLLLDYCLHWEPIAKREASDFYRRLCLAIAYALVTGMFIYITL